MSLEASISNFNEYYFFKEFTYSVNIFGSVSGELEFFDGIVFIDDTLIVIEVKKRGISSVNQEKEKKWFNNKVIKKATKQIKKTLGYLGSEEVILNNHKNHIFNLSEYHRNITKIIKIILYEASDLLPRECKEKKFQKSSKAGFIHLLCIQDYINIVKTLITPAEVIEYLDFREKLIERWPNLIASENAFLGQYISGNHMDTPSEDFLPFLVSLSNDQKEWDISNFIRIFEERLTHTENPHDYYLILQEITKLQRHELKEFRIRLDKSLISAGSDSAILPYRIAIPRLDLGFIFIPLVKTDTNKKLFLEAYLKLHKYEQRLTKCIGLSILAEDNGWYSFEWAYINSPWTKDPLMEEAIEKNYPFREVTLRQLPRYEFKAEKE